MNIALGQDSIADPWYPIGVGNLLRILEMGLHVEHMLGYDTLQSCLDFISINGARNLGVEEQYGIEVGKPANFIILDAKNDYEVIRFHSPVILSVHNGNTIMEKRPANVSVNF